MQCPKCSSSNIDIYQREKRATCRDCGFRWPLSLQPGGVVQDTWQYSGQDLYAVDIIVVK